MTPCPAAGHAVGLLRDRPELPFGIHLTLVCDLRGHSWRPLTDREKVPSLLDETGGFFTPDRIPELLARARIHEVETEFRAQIHAVLDAGLAPAHLDWHCLADGGREDVFELTAALAGEYGLAVRAWLEPARALLRARDLPVLDHDFLDSFSLDLDGKAAAYARLLRDLPPGLSEWAVHPALGGEEARRVDPHGWRVRRSDYGFLTSPQARELLRREGITAIGYDVVQRAWTTG
jgi:predicted glycoside hydrolase/deacetylase ChbG (UPF0249 family)